MGILAVGDSAARLVTSNLCHLHGSVGAPRKAVAAVNGQQPGCFCCALLRDAAAMERGGGVQLLGESSTGHSSMYKGLHGLCTVLWWGGASGVALGAVPVVEIVLSL